MSSLHRGALRLAGAISQAKGRTVLLAVVTAVAVASLGLTISFVQGAERGLDAFFGTLGWRQCTVYSHVSPLGAATARVHPLSMSDLNNLRRQFGGKATFRPTSITVGYLAGEGRRVRAPIVGVDPSVDITTSWAVVVHGRLVDADDAERLSRVVVLNASASHSLFGAANPVGKEVRLRGLPFRVIGSISAKQPVGSPAKAIVFVPISTLLHRILGTNSLNGLTFEVNGGLSVASVAHQVGEALRTFHHIRPPEKDDFFIQTPGGIASRWQRENRSKSMIGWLVSALAILLAGVIEGTVLWLSVEQRRSEIGIRRCLGASRANVWLDLLAEGAGIALLGASVAIGFIAVSLPTIRRAFYVAPTDYSAGSAFTGYENMRLSPLVLAGVVAFALLIGLISSALPAWRATRIDPAEALR